MVNDCAHSQKGETVDLEYWDRHATKLMEISNDFKQILESDEATQQQAIFAAVLVCLEMLRGIHRVIVQGKEAL